MKLDVKELYSKYNDLDKKEIILQGWIRNNRDQKEFGFIDFNDGTFLKGAQVVYEKARLKEFDLVSKYRVGSAITVKGIVELTPEMKQPFEVKATEIILEGDSPEDYPIQPKRHTREFLRTQGYLRPRTNLFNAVFRVRSVLAHAIHSYFQERGYVYTHTPIITGADAEGAGEMFKVTTLEKYDEKTDYSNDFFGKKTSLTVSGQLQAEAFALAYKKVYTFGPTFRAENSNTKIHASEFWMIEPEIAFADLQDDMALMEDFLKYIVKFTLEKCPEEFAFFDDFVEKGIIGKLEKLISSDFTRISHEKAIEILRNSGVKFEFEPIFGEDLATEHERYLTDTHFAGPVFVTDWPKDIKAFYMRMNEDDKTVAAVDLIVPGAGELMGGSQREERLDMLLKRMKEMNVPEEDLEWYLNLRKFGGCKHAGFGMGFERMLIYLTGVENIRDVTPFPRTPNNCDF